MYLILGFQCFRKFSQNTCIVDRVGPSENVTCEALYRTISEFAIRIVYTILQMYVGDGDG